MTLDTQAKKRSVVSSRLGKITLSIEGDRKIPMCFKVIRVESQSAPKSIDSAIRLAFADEGHTERIPGLCVIRLQHKRIAQKTNRLRKIAILCSLEAMGDE
jgi:hypothetical protein